MDSVGYAFWCSTCKISHSGECPPGARAAPTHPGEMTSAHDWEELMITDLSTPSQCRKCGKIWRTTLVALMVGDGRHRRPAGPCPGGPG